MRKEGQGSVIKCNDETEIEIALSKSIEKEQAADLERKENSNNLSTKNENKEENKLECSQDRIFAVITDR